jgi:outer membrane protein assembly factor BamE (lipoprotein component of BamABCDE complex)
MNINMKWMKLVAIAMCGALASCGPKQSTRSPEPNSWTPIVEKENAIRTGMTRAEVEKVLGRSMSNGKVSTFGPFGRAGQTYQVTFSNDTAVEVKYWENPGDK